MIPPYASEEEQGKDGRVPDGTGLSQVEPQEGLAASRFDPSRGFARLFDTPHGQLLAYLDDTDDEEPAITVIGAYVRGVRPSAKLSGWPDGKAGQIRGLADIDQAAAEELAAAFHKMADDAAPSGDRP